MTDLPRGIFESDAAPGEAGYVLYLDGKRCLRIDVRAGGDEEARALEFIWHVWLTNDARPDLPPLHLVK